MKYKFKIPYKISKEEPFDVGELRSVHAILYYPEKSEVRVFHSFRAAFDYNYDNFSEAVQLTPLKALKTYPDLFTQGNGNKTWKGRRKVNFDIDDDEVRKFLATKGDIKAYILGLIRKDMQG